MDPLSEVGMMRLEARAKINWTLDITGIRPDGYHLMDMLMQPIDLSDTLILEPADEIQMVMEGGAGIPADEHNLVLKAAHLLQREKNCDQGVAIHLVKRIPSGAGLGGGSADAAAAMKGLNLFWNLGISECRLREMALSLGADVPFCLSGGLCRVTGIGEQITRIGPGPVWPLLVIQPCEGLSTKTVFQAWDQRHENCFIRTETVCSALMQGAANLLPDPPGNTLQSVSESMRPEIHETVRMLKTLGALTAQMSGSGSAVFGVFASDQQAKKALLFLQNQNAILCHTCDESILLCM